MNYQTWKTAKDNLEMCCKIASDKLQQFPKGEFGLTPKEVKNLPEWQQANREYQTFFNALRTINKGQTKFIKRYAKERRERLNAS